MLLINNQMTPEHEEAVSRYLNFYKIDSVAAAHAHGQALVDNANARGFPDNQAGRIIGELLLLAFDLPPPATGTCHLQ